MPCALSRILQSGLKQLTPACAAALDTTRLPTPRRGGLHGGARPFMTGHACSYTAAVHPLGAAHRRGPALPDVALRPPSARPRALECAGGPAQRRRCNPESCCAALDAGCCSPGACNIPAEGRWVHGRQTELGAAGEAGEGRMFKLMLSGGLAGAGAAPAQCSYCWLPSFLHATSVVCSRGADCACPGECFLSGPPPVWQCKAAQVGLRGAVSRTCTAPVDRLKFLMIMAHPDRHTRLTVRQVRLVGPPPARAPAARPRSSRAPGLPWLSARHWPTRQACLFVKLGIRGMSSILYAGHGRDGSRGHLESVFPREWCGPEWLSVSAASSFLCHSKTPLPYRFAFPGRVAAPLETAPHCTSAACAAPAWHGCSHCSAAPAGANVVKNVPETAIKMGFNDRIKALVVKDGHPITLGAAPRASWSADSWRAGWRGAALHSCCSAPASQPLPALSVASHCRHALPLRLFCAGQVAQCRPCKLLQLQGCANWRDMCCRPQHDLTSLRNHAGS